MTPKEWALCTMVLRAAFASSMDALTTQDLAVWYELLADLPGDAVLASVKDMAKRQAAFPSIADVRRGAEAQPEDAGAAWVRACKWVSDLSLGQVMRDGVLQPLPVMDDPAIAAAVEAVGREAIRHRTPDSEGTCRAHFAKAYAAAVERAKRAEAGLPSGYTQGALLATQGGKDGMLSLSVNVDAMTRGIGRAM